MIQPWTESGLPCKAGTWTEGSQAMNGIGTTILAPEFQHNETVSLEESRGVMKLSMEPALQQGLFMNQAFEQIQTLRTTPPLLYELIPTVIVSNPSTTIHCDFNIKRYFHARYLQDAEKLHVLL
jgi:hypothetical protein